MRKSIILYTLLCAVSSGVSVAHAAVYDQVTQEYILLKTGLYAIRVVFFNG